MRAQIDPLVKRKRNSAALIASWFVLSAVPAVAIEDPKVYPGILCQPNANTVRFSRGISGTIGNSGSVMSTFICPVIHDSFNDPSLIELAHIVVAGAAVNCTIRSRNEIGGASVSLEPSTIQLFPGNVRKLTFAFGPGDFPNTASGAVWFVCDLPPGTGVISYRVDENDNEN